jgi:hypothetical protein
VLGDILSVSRMKQSIRKTPSLLLLAYRYGEEQDSLVGRNFTLEVEGSSLTLGIDLTPNFHSRNKAAASYTDALNLVHNYHRLRSLQCSDNLLRSRLTKAWDRERQPELRLWLDLGGRGSFLYAVLPHSLFTGGIQLDVQGVLDVSQEHIHSNQPLAVVDHIPRNMV